MEEFFTFFKGTKLFQGKLMVEGCYGDIRFFG